MRKRLANLTEMRQISNNFLDVLIENQCPKKLVEDMARIFDTLENFKIKDLKIVHRQRLKKLQSLLDTAGEQMINFEDFFCYDKPKPAGSNPDWFAKAKRKQWFEYEDDAEEKDAIDKMIVTIAKMPEKWREYWRSSL